MIIRSAEALPKTICKSVFLYVLTKLILRFYYQLVRIQRKCHKLFYGYVGLRIPPSQDWENYVSIVPPSFENVFNLSVVWLTLIVYSLNKRKAIALLVFIVKIAMRECRAEFNRCSMGRSVKISSKAANDINIQTKPQMTQYTWQIGYINS